jgi:hypothetical protein
MPQLLLIIRVTELALYRLAVPALQPPGDATPPMWHQLLAYLGLFLFYFASVLGAGVILHQLYCLSKKRPAYPVVLRVLLIVVGASFLTFALSSIARVPTERVTFLLEASFTAGIFALVVAQFFGRGDVGARIGLLILAVPLLIHFYGPFTATFISGEEALWSGVPERVQSYGRWAMLFAALVSPYCFAPRPFVRSATRIGPLAVAGFVGLVGSLIVRQSYEVGAELASRGLGIELGPVPPTSLIALYVMALAAITWTLASCLTAASPARRQIGVGIGLVAAGGYAFHWPLQYLVGFAGLFVIGAAAREVVEEEKGGVLAQRTQFGAPPIASESWQAYIADVVRALRDRGGNASSVTVRAEGGRTRTHVVANLHDVPVKLTVERADDSVIAIQVLCGEDATGEPDWTLHARPAKKLSIGSHPEPPKSSAAAVKTGDAAYDRRFRVRDRGGIGKQMFDDDLRARATALIDGWAAFWSDRGLRYEVLPGRGAPLDHPIPITELAFRGSVPPIAVDKVVLLIDLLSQVTARGLGRGGSPDTDSAEAAPDESES